MNRVQAKVEELRAQCETVAYALLCVGPADMSITSRTQKIGRGQYEPEVAEKLERWLRDDLALHAAREGLAILAEPVLVIDTDENELSTLTLLALTLPWATLRWAK